ncbi:MAG: hypothetical protein MUO63_12095 [Desulfobulbaceae bacterium]|nr:hypothetical protein [Desulfobulbaceae bacterium]
MSKNPFYDKKIPQTSIAISQAEFPENICHENDAEFSREIKGYIEKAYVQDFLKENATEFIQ